MHYTLTNFSTIVKLIVVVGVLPLHHIQVVEEKVICRLLEVLVDKVAFRDMVTERDGVIIIVLEDTINQQTFKTQLPQQLEMVAMEDDLDALTKIMRTGTT